MVGGYDLGRNAAPPLGPIWVVRERLSDEGEGAPLGSGFLDRSVSQCEPLPRPGI